MPYKIIHGEWDDGIAIDNYTVSSTYLGENDFGYPKFDNTYSEIGDLLHTMKYNGKKDTSQQIADISLKRIQFWLNNKDIDFIIPVPPTIKREVQPVFLLAEAFSQKMNIPWAEDVLYKEQGVPVKNINKEDRAKNIHIKQAYTAKFKHNILLIDDLYSSGCTANACVKVLRQDPLIDKIYFLAIAKTKH